MVMLLGKSNKIIIKKQKKLLEKETIYLKCLRGNISLFSTIKIFSLDAFLYVQYCTMCLFCKYIK